MRVLLTSATHGRRARVDVLLLGDGGAAREVGELAELERAQLERDQREGSKKKEYDSVVDEWVHQRVTESESDDDSVEALTVRTPLQ